MAKSKIPDEQVVSNDPVAKIWFLIGMQALIELGRPMVLNMGLANEILDGKWSLYMKRTDDGAYVYKVELNNGEKSDYISMPLIVIKDDDTG